MSKITDIKARYILDSRGNPTIEADVILSNNINIMMIKKEFLLFMIPS